MCDEKPTKFIHMDDNGDGTCTMIIHLGENIQEIIAVVNMDLDEYIKAFQSFIDLPSAAERFLGTTTIIPDDPNI